MLKKLALGDVLKGHSFSRAVENPFEFRPERTLVREGSAFAAARDRSRNDIRSYQGAALAGRRRACFANVSYQGTASAVPFGGR
jgi:hypothetical protein